MSTKKIQEALTVLGECVDAKLADAAMAELKVLEVAGVVGIASLRDTFAAAALMRIPYDPRDPDEFRAARAYSQADAMLAAREGT